MNKVKRRKPSAWPSIMSLALVMFILILWGISIIAFDGIVKTTVEDANLDVYFTEQATNKDIANFIKETRSNPQIKKAIYISPEQGYKEFMNDKTNQDMAEFVSPSTLPNSVELYFHATEDLGSTMSETANKLKANKLIDDVIYNPNVVKNIQKNIHTAQYVLLGICFVFVLISIGLIQSSTRLSIFAQRFIIKSMQLLGATNNFIIKPFIFKNIKYALIAFAVALVMALALLAVANGVMPYKIEWGSALGSINWPKTIGILSAIAIFGILLAIFCVWLSTRKYLRTKIENLY